LIEKRFLHALSSGTVGAGHFCGAGEEKQTGYRRAADCHGCPRASYCPALFAFAASRIADSLYLAAGLISYQNLLETETYLEPSRKFSLDLFRPNRFALVAGASGTSTGSFGGRGGRCGKPHGFKLGPANLFD
jgi:hypothetical protein